MKFSKLSCLLSLILRGFYPIQFFFLLFGKKIWVFKPTQFAHYSVHHHSSPQLKKLKWSWDKQCFRYFMSETLCDGYSINVFWNSFLLRMFFFFFFFGESSWILFKLVVYVQIFKGNVSYTSYYIYCIFWIKIVFWSHDFSLKTKLCVFYV